MSEHWSLSERRMGACCPITGLELVEVLSYHPDGHPLAGEPAKLGKPLDCARRATLALADGSMMQISVHESAVDEILPNLCAIWRRLKASTRHQRRSHRAFGQRPFTPEQNQFADASNCAANDNVPLGVLCVERWSDSNG